MVFACVPATPTSFSGSVKPWAVSGQTAGAVESREVLKWPGLASGCLDWQNCPVTDRGSPWRPRLQSAHPSSGAG